jgi:fatty-acyl-CoA synthase
MPLGLPPTPPTLCDAIDALDSAERGLHFTSSEGEGMSLDYEEVRQRVQHLARSLYGLGLSRGDRVLLVLSDQAEFALAFLAAIRAGIIPVPVYPPFLLGALDGYAGQIERVRRTTDARAALVSDPFRPILERVDPGGRLVSVSDLSSHEERGRLPRVRASDVAFIQFTSGSTSAPKGVAVTHRNVIANAEGIARHLALDPARDRGVSWLPLYHDMGLIGFLLMPLILQIPIWHLPPLEFAARPQRWLELVHRVRATISFAPNFAYDLVGRRVTPGDVEKWDLRSWRVAGCGAEPVRAATLRSFAERLAPAGFEATSFVPCYGLAEATLAVTASRLGGAPVTTWVDPDRLCGTGRAEHVVGPPSDRVDGVELVSCGRALSGTELRIVNAVGRALPEGREGEILVRSPGVASGYWNNPQATASAFRGDGLHTGDLGFLLDGELYVTGRKKDLVILNGTNYHPHDIEEAVADLQGVRRGGVVAFARRGPSSEELVVVVEATGETGDLSRRVRSLLRRTLGLPVADVVSVERGTLPKTSSGKLRRCETRERYLQGVLPATRVRSARSASGPFVPSGDRFPSLAASP